jgi:hypothetical protein
MDLTDEHRPHLTARHRAQSVLATGSVTGVLKIFLLSPQQGQIYCSNHLAAITCLSWCPTKDEVGSFPLLVGYQDGLIEMVTISVSREASKCDVRLPVA